MTPKDKLIMYNELLIDNFTEDIKELDYKIQQDEEFQEVILNVYSRVQNTIKQVRKSIKEFKNDKKKKETAIKEYIAENKKLREEAVNRARNRGS